MADFSFGFCSPCQSSMSAVLRSLCFGDGQPQSVVTRLNSREMLPRGAATRAAYERLRSG